MKRAGEEAGIVYIVGAGPGDPGLITVRGLECLQNAEVILYDRLVAPSLLAMARSEARLVDVGKAPGGGMSQDEINRLLYEEASAGKVVCRLKGGDPFLLGRGSEEAEYLAERGVRFEIVPGITSALAVPAYAGIPATDRRYSSVVAIATGHEDPSKAEPVVAWEKLALAADTVIVLMGVGNLRDIASKLMAGGRAADTPAAAIHQGTTPKQKTVVATLADIADRAQEAGITPPAIVVVGEVVRLRDALKWVENRPLFGKTVLVTRPAHQAAELSTLLRQHGADTLEVPVLELRTLTADAGSVRSLMAEPFDWVVFTSVNGVHGFVEQLRSAGLDIRALGSARLAAIGSATARALEGLGLNVSFVPARFTSEHIVAEFPRPLDGKRILMPRAKDAPARLREGLENAGARVVEWDAYETAPARIDSAALAKTIEEGRIQITTFTSGLGVRALTGALGKDVLQKTTVACIGPMTAAAARELGLNVDIVAEEHTVPGLVRAILEAARRSP